MTTAFPAPCNLLSSNLCASHIFPSSLRVVRQVLYTCFVCSEVKLSLALQTAFQSHINVALHGMDSGVDTVFMQLLPPPN